MFTKSARFYDLLYAKIDYPGEADRLCALIEQLNPSARTLLDLGCGTGRHLERLRHRFVVQGIDINPELLAIAQARCPDVRLHQKDIAGFSLDSRFDVVTCLFSAIGYVKTLDRLKQTIAAAAQHLNSGGVILVEPWFTPDQYWADTITANFVDEPDCKIAWMYTSRRRERLSILDITYMVGTQSAVNNS
jgi:predicted TPR repeat methyltransferase